MGQDAAVVVPASCVTVPASADRATFPVRTSWLSPSANGTGSRTDTVTATYGGRTRPATLKCFR